MARLTLKDLLQAKKKPAKVKNWIKVGYGSCGIAAGAEEVFKTLREEVKRRRLQIEIKKCGCIGMCYAEPLVEVQTEGTPRVFYGKVDREFARKIVEKHVCGKMLINDHIYDIPLTQ